MTYDVLGKYDKGPVSELQWKILMHVCKHKGANFKSLCKETGRSRTTIIQSIEPMIGSRCIDKKKVDLLLVKSKLTFTPTYKGKCYAESGGMKVEHIFLTESDPYIISYLQIVDQLSDVSQRKIMLRELASNVLDLSVIDEQGNIKTEDKISALKDAFCDAVTSLIQNVNYNATSLFNDKTIEWLSKFFSADEIKELKELLLKIKKNTDSTIQILSKL